MEPAAENITFTFELTWGNNLQIAICERCDWGYLLPVGSLPQRCPHCFEAELTNWHGDPDNLPYLHSPELTVPFAVSAPRLSTTIQKFTSGIPFPPEDLTPDNLQARMRRIYLPMWLVDANVIANWQTEAGFDYRVVSHQDRFDENRGGWTSQQVNEGRIRWETRLGRLNRRYLNILAPALEDEEHIKNSLGAYDLKQALAYQPQMIEGAYIRLPNRSPQDAWSDAKPAFQKAAADECRQAARAGHVRQFTWQPEYLNQNWSLLLLPVFATYYQDDEGRPQPVLVNGQHGQITGARRASMKHGQRVAVGMLAAAMTIFLVSLAVSVIALAFPPLLALGIIGLVAALLVGFGAIFPVASVWWFNRSQSGG